MKNENGFFERRNQKRKKKSLDVSCRVINVYENAPVKKDAGKTRTGECFDISGGGMQVLYGEEIRPLQLIKLEFEIGDGGRKVQTIGEVKWTEYDRAMKLYRTGIEFLVMKASDIELIKKLCAANGA